MALVNELESDNCTYLCFGKKSEAFSKQVQVSPCVERKDFPASIDFDSCSR